MGDASIDIEMENSPCWPSPPPLPDMSSGSLHDPPALSGRPVRKCRLPRHVQDILPEAPPVLPEPVETTSTRCIRLIVRDRLVTIANTFGIWRDYPRRPTRDPDASLTLTDLSTSTHHTTSDPVDIEEVHDQKGYWPFSNSTVHGIMKWLNNGNSMKSEAETTKLVHDVFLSPEFDPEHLIGFNAHVENQRLDKELKKSKLRSLFKETDVDILVPSGDPNVKPQKFTVPGLLHRGIVAVVREAFSSPLSHLYHFTPFKLYQQSPVTKEAERVYGEIYTSDSFLEEHEKIQRAPVPPEDPHCQREKVVTALMFSSDATQLADFGNAKGWPIYLMLGNLTKYIRAQPKSGAMHHLAYIPSVSELYF